MTARVLVIVEATLHQVINVFVSFEKQLVGDGGGGMSRDNSDTKGSVTLSVNATDMLLEPTMLSS